MIRQLGVVLRKELVDNLRDRRSLGTALIMPVMGPILFFAMFTAFAAKRDTDKPLEIAVMGAENAPNLVAHLRQHGATVIPVSSSPEERVRRKQVEVALIIPPEYGQELETGRPAHVQLVTDESRTGAFATTERARRLLLLYGRQITVLRLAARGVSPLIATPLMVEEIDVATSQQRGAILLMMIPLFLLMSVVMGGMYAAIDTTAGERERGSLEPLLINPAARWAIVLGKWLAVVVLSWLPFPLCVALFQAVLARVPLHQVGISAGLGLDQAAWMLAVLLPLAPATAALSMLVATFARSFKEAQNYVTVLLTFAILPPSMLFLVDQEQTWMRIVPLISQQSLLIAVMRHEPLSPSAFALASGVSLAIAAVCLAAVTRLLGKERIVFGR